MKYHDIILEATEPAWEKTPDKGRVGRFKVRVVQSPDGWMSEPVPVEYDDKALQLSLGRLERRDLDRDGLIALGRTLATLLLPPRGKGQEKGVRDYLANSLLSIGPDAGLRLRLRLPRQLQALPWEYMYVERGNGDPGIYGFLSLDPRVVIIRHEELGMPLQPTQLKGDIKVLVAMASAGGPQLDLGREKAILEKAFAGRAGIQPVYLEDATLAEILAASSGSGVFYFAGHGMFPQQMSELPGTYTGTGQLALDDGAVDGETLGANLLGSGVRLVVLGGCETGRRDGKSVWSGIAPALVKAQIPAVVANQYSIRDDCAIAFSQQFYAALVGGQPIEMATSLGRKAALNADKEGRDWGVPVLYLQAEEGTLFEGAADAGVRQQARKEAEVKVSVHVNEVAAGGTVIGGDVGQMLSGKLVGKVTVDGTVYGEVIGVKIKTLGGGAVDEDMDVGTVGKGGVVTGVRIDSLGGTRGIRIDQEIGSITGGSVTGERRSDVDKECTMSNETRRYGLFDFNDYIEKRVADFTGREWVFQDIDRWLVEENPKRYYLLKGEPGGGKSAVAARLTQFSAGEVPQPPSCKNLIPGFLGAVHFCSTTAGDWVDARTFARSLALQLSKIDTFKEALLNVGDRAINNSVQVETGPVASGGSVTGQIIQNVIIQGLNGQETFNCIVLGPLRTIYDDGYKQPIIILVDSLDEALGFSNGVKIVDLLASVQGMDSRVRFIMTSRPEPRVENKFPAPTVLSLSDPAHKGENDSDIALFVASRLERDAILAAKVAALPAAQAATLPADLSARADGNFQFISFLLEAAAKGQQSLSDLGGLPAGLDSLYHNSLDRVVTLGKKDRDTVYKPFLGVLAVALEPLTLDLLKTYTGSPTSLWNVYVDLIQFVEAMPASPLPGERANTDDCYRLFHQSMIDFLHKQQWVEADSGQNYTNEYYMEPDDSHTQIVAACEGPEGSWAQVKWNEAAPYTLRRLVAHLYQLRQRQGYSNKLHALLEARSFVDQHLATLGKPNLLLDDFRLALTLALAADDLAQAWRHIREYRRIVRHQLDVNQLVQAVETGNRTGDYVQVTERTTLYGYLPNPQALARLWIAWNAAASGHTKAAETILKTALERLPLGGTAQIASRQAGSSATQAVEDAFVETLQRLLTRIAQAAENTDKLQEQWLRGAISFWPTRAVDATVGWLSKSMASWGESFGAGQMSDTMASLLQELQARAGHLDEEIYYFQSRLAAGLFNNRHDPEWLENVQRAVTHIALDDYPSYREMALFWVAAGILAQEDTVLAQKALVTVLGGMFRPSPGFWGDSVAAAMDGMARENNEGPNPYLLGYLKHVEATGERGVDPSLPRKPEIIMEWRKKVGLPADPWSLSIRRRSAVAAVLYRRGDVGGAEALLREASAEPHEGSYAGFRALARLSLACRWLEWRRLPEAGNETSVAETDASYMRDNVLRQERLDLVNKMRRWLTDYGQNPTMLNEDEAMEQLQWKSGLERGLFLEFLSALWSDNTARLKRLLPPALDDATTADAVLGRLLGIEALHVRTDKPFLQLVKALQIDAGIENE